MQCSVDQSGEENKENHQLRYIALMHRHSKGCGWFQLKCGVKVGRLFALRSRNTRHKSTSKVKDLGSYTALRGVPGLGQFGVP